MAGAFRWAGSLGCIGSLDGVGGVYDTIKEVHKVVFPKSFLQLFPLRNRPREGEKRESNQVEGGPATSIYYTHLVTYFTYPRGPCSSLQSHNQIAHPQTDLEMSVRKSPPPPTSQQGALTKRARVDDDDQDDGNDGGMTMTVASSGVAGGKGALVRSVKRTSGLAAPIVSLGGAHRVSPDDLAGVVVMCLLSSD